MFAPSTTPELIPTPAIEALDTKCETIGELNDEIVGSLFGEGLTREELIEKGIANKVFNVIIGQKLLLNTTPNTIKRVVMYVLDTLS